MKPILLIGATVGGAVGSWLGGTFDHGNMFGAWGIVVGAIGGIAGIIGAYKYYQNYVE